MEFDGDTGRDERHSFLYSCSPNLVYGKTRKTRRRQGQRLKGSGSEVDL